MSTPCPHCGQRYWPASAHDSAWCLQTQMTKAPVSASAEIPPVAWVRSTPSGMEFVPYRGTLLDDAGWTRLYDAPRSSTAEHKP